jgi:hypothetical protein
MLLLRELYIIDGSGISIVAYDTAQTRDVGIRYIWQKYSYIRYSTFSIEYFVQSYSHTPKYTY